MAKSGSLSINSENIFPIIKKWLYSDHDIFYRELVSNGCDAITKLKKLALMGEDYQDIFRQQVRESAEREKAGLSRPVWIAQAYQQQIAESRRPEEETTPRET